MAASPGCGRRQRLRVAGAGQAGTRESPVSSCTCSSAIQHSRSAASCRCWARSASVCWSGSRICEGRGGSEPHLEAGSGGEAPQFGHQAPSGLPRWAVAPSLSCGRTAMGSSPHPEKQVAQPALHSQTWEAPVLPSSVLFYPIGHHLWGCYLFSGPLLLSLSPPPPPPPIPLKQLGALGLNHLPHTRLRRQS